MPYNLFLDDERVPYQAVLLFPEAELFFQTREWVVARNYPEFAAALDQLGIPDAVSFDHDLGDVDASTGLECAEYLVEKCMNEDAPLPAYFVHSANPAGRLNIQSYLSSYEKSLTL
jgi:hypothetical protein